MVLLKSSVEAMKGEMPDDRMQDGYKMPVLFISSVANKGLIALKDVLWSAMNEQSFSDR